MLLANSAFSHYAALSALKRETLVFAQGYFIPDNRGKYERSR